MEQLRKMVAMKHSYRQRIFIVITGMIYLLFKPRFMSKYEFFANYTVSKSQLSVYYLLSILVSYWIFLKNI